MSRITCIILLMCAASNQAALTFNLTPDPGMDQQAVDGFVEAGELWSSLFSDDVTVNIDIGFQPLDPGVLGQASSTRGTVTFSNFKTAMSLDATSTDDATAVANLPAGSAFDMLINRTANHPDGAGSATPYLDDDGDANNMNIRMTTANAKALGLLSPTDSGSDAAITFNSDFTWDFDRSDGISGGSFDFVGVAAHEIGHALGFISGVDVLDTNSSDPFFNDDQFTFVSPLDLFRFSNESVGEGAGVIDWTADDRSKFFSIDGGATNLGTFSTGVVHGDGRQASHWEDSLGLGLMDPTFSSGEFGDITALDIQSFDVTGWDLASLTNVIPAPGAFQAGLMLMVLALGRRGCFCRHSKRI